MASPSRCFQVGGNFGSALGPLLAAFIVLRWGQSSVAWGALLALVGIFVLWNVAIWYRTHGLQRIKAAPKAAEAREEAVSCAGPSPPSASFLALIFSKYVYLAQASPATTPST